MHLSVGEFGFASGKSNIYKKSLNNLWTINSSWKIHSWTLRLCVIQLDTALPKKQYSCFLLRLFLWGPAHVALVVQNLPTNAADTGV